MDRKIRLGVLGCSAIGERSVLPAIKRNQQIELIAVGSRSLVKAQYFAEKFACKSGTYADILTDGSIDAVYVSLPVGMHYDWGIKVIKANKHLLLEKTFTDSLSTAQDLIATAKQNGVVAMEALPYVYHPLFRHVREIVTSGQLGKLRHIEAFFGLPYLPESDIRNNAKLGGGAILDALVYPLSFCLHIGGADYSTYSQNVLCDKKRGIDTRGFIQIDWCEYSAHIAYGFGFMYRNSYSVWGETAYLTAERVFPRPPDLISEISILRQGKVDAMTVEAANHFELMLDAFANKINGTDDSGLNENNDILTRMRIISAVHQYCYNSTLLA